jgi:UrcA family protein
MAAKLVLQMAALLAGAALAMPAAHADVEVWRVGPNHQIRFDHLDLEEPTDRQALLVQVERTAKRICGGIYTAKSRNACIDRTMESALASAAPNVRLALQTARLERSNQLQAKR